MFSRLFSRITIYDDIIGFFLSPQTDDMPVILQKVPPAIRRDLAIFLLKTYYSLSAFYHDGLLFRDLVSFFLRNIQFQDTIFKFCLNFLFCDVLTNIEASLH